MFTGIVKGKAKILDVDKHPGLSTLHVEIPAELSAGIELGASVAFDGVCLTVAGANSKNSSQLSFDVMLETLNKTTLGSLKAGDVVNVERSAREGVEVGGHILSGHVDTKAVIVRIDQPENNYVLTFKVEPEWLKYIFAKGYLALNGTSLTVAAVNKEAATLTVWLIPETLRITTWGSKKVGDLVNLEIDRNTQVIVDTVRSFLEEKLGPKLRDIF